MNYTYISVYFKPKTYSIVSRISICVSFSWQRCIINNAHRLVELCVTKLSQDWFPLLELLAMATNPHCKFHIYNGTRPSETVPAGVQLAEDELFARPPDPRSPKVRGCLCQTFKNYLNVLLVTHHLKYTLFLMHSYIFEFWTCMFILLCWIQRCFVH